MAKTGYAVAIVRNDGKTYGSIREAANDAGVSAVRMRNAALGVNGRIGSHTYSKAMPDDMDDREEQVQCWVCGEQMGRSESYPLNLRAAYGDVVATVCGSCAAEMYEAMKMLEHAHHRGAAPEE